MAQYYPNNPTPRYDFYLQPNYPPQHTHPFHLQKPQPTLLPPNQHTQSPITIHKSNEVPKSNDILASFGFEGDYFVQQNEQKLNREYRNENKDLELTRKLDKNRRWGERDRRHKNDSPKQKIKIVELNEQRNFHNLRRTQNFYSFLYKLSGILSFHVKIIRCDTLFQIKQANKKNNQNAEYISQLLKKLTKKKLESAFIHFKFNSMQHSEVVPVYQDIQNSESKTFTKEYTKIDMLADYNIEDFSEEPSSREYMMKYFESQNKSERQESSAICNEEEKMKMFNFHDRAKRKNDNIFIHYGYGMEEIIKNTQTSNLSIFSNKGKKDIPVQECPPSHHPKKYFSSPPNKPSLNDTPLNGIFFSEENYIPKIQQLKNDPFKQSLQDICVSSHLFNESQASLQSSFKVGWNKQTEYRRLEFLNPIIKNVDSLIENKISRDYEGKYGQNRSISRSIESLRISEGDSQGHLNYVGKSKNLIKPVEEYQTHKDFFFGRQIGDSKKLKSENSLDRPKSMTFIKVASPNSKYLQHPNPSSNIQPHCRPTSFLATPNNQQINTKIIKTQPFRGQSSSSQKQRAHSGYHTYYQSPPLKNRHALQEPLKVYFSTSPSKPIYENKQINQKAPANLPHNFYGIKKQISPGHHYYLNSQEVNHRQNNIIPEMKQSEPIKKAPEVMQYREERMMVNSGKGLERELQKRGRSSQKLKVVTLRKRN